jgi:hypothetical protein
MRDKTCAAFNIGVAGALITMSLNLIAFLVLKHPAALPYHDQWWSSWFPIYAVWFVFLMIGVALHASSSKRDG